MVLTSESAGQRARRLGRLGMRQLLFLRGQGPFIPPGERRVGAHYGASLLLEEPAFSTAVPLLLRSSISSWSTAIEKQMTHFLE